MPYCSLLVPPELQKQQERYPQSLPHLKSVGKNTITRERGNIARLTAFLRVLHSCVGISLVAAKRDARPFNHHRSTSVGSIVQRARIDAIGVTIQTHPQIVVPVYGQPPRPRQSHKWGGCPTRSETTTLTPELINNLMDNANAKT